MAFDCVAFGWTEYFQDEPGVSHLQPDPRTSSGQCPAVRCRQVPLMVFRVGRVNSGHGPLALRDV